MHQIKQRVFFVLTPMLLLCCFFVSAQHVYAQQGDGESASTMNQGSPVTPNDVNEVAKELWCPLCSGVRLDACELKACDQMRDMIAEQLEEGQEKQQIKDYFLEQYGPQVLGEPPLEGFNLLAWILPFVAMVGGGVFVWRRTRSMVSSGPQEPVIPASPTPGDEYNQRLDEELKRYD
jgi:cytochrome c-type biogenesis protein CcmH